MPLVLRGSVLYPLLAAAGVFFAYRLAQIPSRLEIAAFVITLFLVPSLKYPKVAIYFLLGVPLFIPLFRRMYYLVGDRVREDYIMLIPDGIMAAFLASLLLIWIYNRERCRDALSTMVVAYSLWLLVKVFYSENHLMASLHGFKFNGFLVMFYFAGSYFTVSPRQLGRIVAFCSALLLVTALYSIQQILVGFTAYERAWLDSITFTTLLIEGHARPFGTYVSPAALADGMCLLLLAGCFWLSRPGAARKWAGLLLVLSSIYPLLIATVRTNWIAALAGLFFYFIFLNMRGTWRKASALVLLLACAVFFSLGSRTQDETQNRQLSSHMQNDEKNLHDIMVRERLHAVADPLGEYSLLKRLEVWREIGAFSVKRPLGRGQGMSGYAHSYYFQVLGEAGYPGILLFLALLIMLFRRGLEVIRISRDPHVVDLARFFLTVLFVFSILNLTGTHLHSNPGDIYFWFSAGALVFLYRRTREEEGPGGGPEEHPGGHGDTGVNGRRADG